MPRRRTPTSGSDDHIDALFADLGTHLSVEELAVVLGVKEKTAYRWLNDGVVPAYKLAGTWVILRDEIKDSLRAGSNQHASTADSPNPWIENSA